MHETKDYTRLQRVGDASVAIGMLVMTLWMLQQSMLISAAGVLLFGAIAVSRYFSESVRTWTDNNQLKFLVTVIILAIVVLVGAMP